ncbi:nucleoside deaminase [Mycobacterium neumannii]|uniref:nucleoside deaminase n=1 Tax=Mycobacterium neumannii TaxID=2048551 RepID=UPI003AB80639
MHHLQRRAVLLGAGLLAGMVSSPFTSGTPASAQPSATEADLALLRRTFALANEARANGNTPFGALVADAGGNVIVERGNESAPPDGDPTRHAEVVATAAAWHVLGDDGMNAATLYASAEPCAMCAGAAYWTGIGRIVYGMPENRLLELTGNNPENPTFSLPCREVLAHGQRPITIVGPLLEDEAAQPHQGYWS